MRSPHIALLALVLTTACGKGKDDAHPVETTGTTTPAPTATVAPKPEPTVAPKPVQHVELQIASVANSMTFDKAALTVPTGAEVHLVLKNNATVATMPHNWVLVKPGTEASVALAGVKLDQAGYVDVRDHDMLAHTTQAKPGESIDVTFTAPEVGTYPYICTTPGHYMSMKGVLTVTP
jgi:azurin